jgi:hypothetical protein
MSTKVQIKHQYHFFFTPLFAFLPRNRLQFIEKNEEKTREFDALLKKTLNLHSLEENNNNLKIALSL